SRVRGPPEALLFPYTTLFRSRRHDRGLHLRPVGTPERPLGVLEAVTGHREDDRRILPDHPRLSPLEETRDRDRRRGLGEDADLGGEDALGAKNLGIAEHAEVAVAVGVRREREVPRRRVADADRARDSLRVLHDLAANDRRAALSLEPEHPR